MVRQIRDRREAPERSHGERMQFFVAHRRQAIAMGLNAIATRPLTRSRIAATTLS
jgi:hypothetical protein